MNNIVPVDEPICADAVVHQPHARFLLLLHPAMSQILGRVVDMLAAGLRELSCTVEITNARQRGLSVKAVFGVYGAELDEFISRSKVVINIHFYPNGRLEMIRLFDLLANARTVVREVNPGETVDNDLQDAFVGAPYERLADVTEALVRDPVRCAQVAAAGKAALKNCCARTILREAIDWSEAPRIPANAVVGSRKSYDPGLFNLDIEARWHPDIVADISDPDLFAKDFSSPRFGTVRLKRGQFDSITASHVLEHIPDLMER